MKVLAQAGCYHCGECGDRLSFDPIKVSEIDSTAIGACINDDRFSNITGELLRKGCPRAGVRMRVPVQIIECEVIP